MLTIANPISAKGIRLVVFDLDGALIDRGAPRRRR
jgi:hypothetical protein